MRKYKLYNITATRFELLEDMLISQKINFDFDIWDDNGMIDLYIDDDLLAIKNPVVDDILILIAKHAGKTNY